ncbi:MAG: S46 family peptidase, partial [Bacteroidota bacterium]
AQSKEKNGEKGFTEALPKLKEALEEFYKEFNPEVDKKLFAALMEMYVTNNDKAILSPQLIALASKHGGNYEKMADDIYNATDLDDAAKTIKALNENPTAITEGVKNEMVSKMFQSLVSDYNKNVSAKLNPIQARINALQRTYMQAQMDVFNGKVFYPDANSTLRVTYGQVKPYEPRDAVEYDYYTYVDGIMEKYKPGDYEFDVPEKLLELYRTKNYGQYASKGKMPVCFIGTNHTTGGNSGSPALDAYGNLVGLNFDRVWEGTMSDLNYDPSICRNIMVDIRYVLFIVDKFAGATHLINEMKLVHPKAKRPI